MNILVLHGPNLNLHSGARSLEAIDASLKARAKALGVEVKTVQSNQEGVLLDALAQERHWFDALIVNPAVLAPNAAGLAEAIALIEKPAIEVQLDDGKKAKSALKDVVKQQIHGRGPNGYLDALAALVPADSKPQKPQKSLGARTVEAAVAQAKTIGRAEAPTDKTIGRVSPTGEIVKSIGGKQRPALQKKPPPPSAPNPRSLGKRKVPAASAKVLSRAIVRQQIADRLSGSVTPAELAAWARAEWQKVQSGGPIESGQQQLIEDVLQTLLLSATMKASDDSLIELMTQLGG